MKCCLSVSYMYSLYSTSWSWCIFHVLSIWMSFLDQSYLKLNSISFKFFFGLTLHKPNTKVRRKFPNAPCHCLYAPGHCFCTQCHCIGDPGHCLGAVGHCLCVPSHCLGAHGHGFAPVVILLVLVHLNASTVEISIFLIHVNVRYALYNDDNKSLTIITIVALCSNLSLGDAHGTWPLTCSLTRTEWLDLWPVHVYRVSPRGFPGSCAVFTDREVHQVRKV